MTRLGAKALNKPLLIVGIDRKLAGLAFIFSVIIGGNDGGSKIAAVVLFVVDVCRWPMAHAQRPEHLPCPEPGAQAQDSLRSREAADQE